MSTGLILMLLFFSAVIYARDNGQWAQSSPERRQFFESLKNKSGILCCSNADGEDAEWELNKGQYRVKLQDEWVIVPPDAVLTVRNPYGGALVWWRTENGVKGIRCFLPGLLI